MSDRISWIRDLPEVGTPVLDRLAAIEERAYALKRAEAALRRDRRALVREVRALWSDADILKARGLVK